MCRFLHCDCCFEHLFTLAHSFPCLFGIEKIARTNVKVLNRYLQLVNSVAMGVPADVNLLSFPFSLFRPAMPFSFNSFPQPHNSQHHQDNPNFPLAIRPLYDQSLLYLGQLFSEASTVIPMFDTSLKTASACIMFISDSALCTSRYVMYKTEKQYTSSMYALAKYTCKKFNSKVVSLYNIHFLVENN